MRIPYILCAIINNYNFFSIIIIKLDEHKDHFLCQNEDESKMKGPKC